MRAYLDTNILAFLLMKNEDEIERPLRDEILEYSSILMTSTVCVHELIHLQQIGKLDFDPKNGDRNQRNILDELEEMGISIVPVSKRHLQEYAALPFFDDHRDPNDRLIIAQAIADRTSLISSDRKFFKYGRYGLDFLFNER